MYRILHNERHPGPIQNHNFRDTPGIDISWRGGDVIRPLNGKWFDEPEPTRVLRFWCPWRVLPFIRWRIGRTVGYAGFKAFGVDSEHYKDWLPAERVQVGSVALTPSWRWDADDH
jgi:hypothetical protein